MYILENKSIYDIIDVLTFICKWFHNPKNNSYIERHTTQNFRRTVGYKFGKMAPKAHGMLFL